MLFIRRIERTEAYSLWIYPSKEQIFKILKKGRIKIPSGLLREAFTIRTIKISPRKLREALTILKYKYVEIPS